MFAFARTQEEADLEHQLNNTILEQLDHFDFSALDEMIESLNFQFNSPFSSGSFKDKVQEIIAGEFSNGYSSVFEAILALVLSNVISFLPLFAILICIGVLSSFISNLSPNIKNKSISDVIHFVCYSIIIVLVFSAVARLITTTSETLANIKTQMDLIFPVLLTIMTALGATAAASVYQPAVAIFSSAIVQLFSSIIMPLFIFTLVFNVVGNLSSNMQLKKFHEFFHSSFKWLVGTTFTVFTAFLSIQGITAGSLDKVSLRTAKFAIKSYIPIIGGYLSDGFNVIMASGVLIKNAVGLAGLFIMFFTILMPLVELFVLKLGLNLTAAVLEPIVDKRMSNFIMAVSKSLIMLLTTILAIAFMYFIMIGLIVSTANLV
jgi:stage III sporulation protein AE